MAHQQLHNFAPQPSTERGRPIQLGVDPKGVQFLYTNGRSVIIRDLANPAIATEYNGHGCQATVARFSPSGYYIASGGNIRVWDTTQAEHILKIETKIFSGKINDLDWDFESKRIIGVGEGKDKFGHAFLFDSASSVGEISGHSKAINSVSIRPGRPLRAITGSDDMSVNFYHGVPFKFNKSLKDHSRFLLLIRFVQCVRYSLNGDHFITCGSDSQIYLYDGKSGDKISILSSVENSHKGSIYSASWSPDSTQILTGSGDMTAKIWDLNAQKVITTYNFSGSPSIEHQQVGTLWSGSYLISASLSGDLNYIDPRIPDRPARVIKGHQRGITAMTVTDDKKIYTGSYDGRICSWDLGVGGSADLKGIGHTNQVVALGTDQTTVYSCGMDDTLRSLSISTKSYSDSVISTGSIPKNMSVSKKTVAIVTGADGILLYTDGKKIGSIKSEQTPTSTAISPSESTLANGKISIYSLPTMTLTTELQGNKAAITTLAFSPNGAYLAAGDTESKIICYETKTHEVLIDEWVFHNAKINCLAWSADSMHCVSGSLDTNIEVWSTAEPMRHIAIKNAHIDGVTGVAFLDNDTIASCGTDAFVKVFKINYN